MNFSILPNLIALAILVGVFWAISRKATTERLDLWLAGWFLVLLHFCASFLTPISQPWNNIMTAVSLDALILAAIAFVISVSTIASTPRRRMLVALAIGVPCVLFTNAAIWEVANHAFYYVVVAAGVIAPVALLWRFNDRGRVYATGLSAGTIIAGLIAARGVANDHPEVGIIVVLTALNLLAAVLFWRQHGRVTAGVLTTVTGFLLWGAVFPIAALLNTYAPKLNIDSEVWNIPKYLVAVGMILTLLENQIERSTYLAYHDELTGLPNRRLLDDRLERALALAKRTGYKVAVLLLDLDRFKDVNDTYGHRLGDLALQGVVGRLATRLRSSDTLARSGGDEFTVVSAVRDREGAQALVADLEASLTVPMNIENVSVQTGLSIGVAMYPEDGSNADQLHAAADKAMYVAKRAARAAVANVVAD